MKSLFFELSDLPDFFSRERLSGDSLFVFSTDVVKDSWIDWIVSHPEKTGMSAVPLDKFTAWDKFKGDFASSRDKESGKGTVPALLRKLFVRDLISRNKTERLFRSLIVPEYAGDALSFTDWMASMLPSLDFWHKSYLAYLKDAGIPEGGDADAENQDLLFLYREYSAFLDEHKLYEPSWIEPDFTGKAAYYLIYPELLEDFSDYGEAFASARNITAVHLPPLASDAEGFEDKKPVCYAYPDSRMELRRTLLLMRRLVKEGKARWQDISLSVPDIDLYRPYLERESERYCVPTVIHAGESLLKSSAATVFGKLYDCHTSRFSYDSVRALLLDAHIPWKKEFRILIGNLVREGCLMHCVCQYDDGKDIWEESLSATRDRNERELAFYTELKKGTESICKADSFANILVAWMVFKKDMLDAGDFSSVENLILGRCVEELKKLILVWEDYVEGTGLTLENPYEFFLTELKGTKYLLQDKSAGVHVYPYRLSAGAAFSYQFVIDASQTNLEVPVKRLSFLSTAKRKKLGLLDREKKENPSVPFIRLYAGLGESGAAASAGTGSYSGPAFSFAQDSFAGFAIAHSFLRQVECDSSLDEDDFLAGERNWFLSGGEGKAFPFSGKMKQEALRWLEGRKPLPDSGEQAVKDKLLSLVMRKSGNPDDGRIRISQSDLKSFFPCQRNWIFNRLFRLDDDSLTAELSGPFDIGNINHKVLERFMLWRMQDSLPLPVTGSDGSFGKDESEIYDKLRIFAGESIDDYSMSFRDSILSKLSFRVQKDAIARTVLDCLHSMCRADDGKKLSFGGWGIFAAEKKLTAEGEKGNWVYEGKIDCMLKDGLGNLAIVDYKSGKAPAISSCIAEEDGSLGDFQMPMYMLLCEEEYKAADVDFAAFYSIKLASPVTIVQPNERKGRSKSVDRMGFSATMDSFSGYAGTFYEKIIACDLTPVAGKPDIYNGVDAYKDCSKCSFRTICRTSFGVAGRRLSPAQVT